MPHKWLAFFAFGLLTVMVLAIFYVQSRPIDLDASIKVAQEEAGTLAEPTVTVVNPMLGSADAHITLVLFADFTCQPCKELAASILEVIKTYPQDVRLVWKDAPQYETSSVAAQSAVAAHCADRQGKFWEYADELFTNQTTLDAAEDLLHAAQSVSLDIERFNTCMETQDTLPIVERDYKEGRALGLVASPTLFLNDMPYTGALSFEQLLTYVEEELSNN